MAKLNILFWGVKGFFVCGHGCELFKPKPMEPLGHNIVAQIVSKKHREKLVRGPHDIQTGYMDCG
jgi:hypothetical protein